MGQKTCSLGCSVDNFKLQKKQVAESGDDGPENEVDYRSVPKIYKD